MKNSPIFIQAAIQVLLFLFPWSIRRKLLVWLFKYDIHPRAQIWKSIVLCNKVVMGPGSRIGNYNLIRGLEELRFDEESTLGHFNWISGLPLANKNFYALQPERMPMLHFKHHASVTSRHRLDCIDTITIGAFTTVGGWGTQILTHSVDIKTSRQQSGPVTIGDYCFVGTRSLVLKGAVLPDYSVLGAGSTLAKAYSEPYGIYSGVPAIFMRTLDPESEYFHRTTRSVS